MNKVSKKEIATMDRLIRKQASRVYDVEKTLLNVFDQYKKKPRWSLLQVMFALCYRLGWERKTYSFYENKAMMMYEKNK